MSLKSLFLFAFLVAMSNSAFARQKSIETYRATENDGTPTFIRSSTPLTQAGILPKPLHPLAHAELNSSGMDRQKARFTERSEIEKEDRTQDLSEEEIKKEEVAIANLAEVKPSSSEPTKGETSFAPVEREENRSLNPKFDFVPQQHLPEVAERMKYAHEILLRFGRAYDYRTLTARNFKELLKQLSQQKSQ